MDAPCPTGDLPEAVRGDRRGPRPGLAPVGTGRGTGGGWVLAIVATAALLDDPAPLRLVGGGSVLVVVLRDLATRGRRRS